MNDNERFGEDWVSLLKKQSRALEKSSGFRYLEVLRTAGAARKITYNGREHYVVPVVALMEGVIHAVNAKDAEFVPFKTFSQNVNQWNGRPIMLGHPVRDGIHIAASDPTVLESGCFGSIFNTRIENKRLLMDAYVDPERLIALGREDVLTRVIDGKPIEISVGAQVATDTKPGEHNGRAYKSSWMALSADHLAFLPDGRGACSIEMGCGAHRAMASEDDMDETLGKRVLTAIMTALGGPGSGDFGHEGRPGQVGGSGEGDSNTKSGGTKSGGINGKGDTIAKRVRKVHLGLVEKGFFFKKQTKERDGDLTITTDHYKNARGEEMAIVTTANTSLSWIESSNADEKIEIKEFSRRYPRPKLRAAEDEEDNSMDDETFGEKVLSVIARALGGSKKTEPVPAKERELAKYKDCPVCQGSGNANGNPCDACEGSGELRTAEQGDDMNKKDLIAKLVACECSGYKPEDATALEGFSEARLTVMADNAASKQTQKEAEDEAKAKTQRKTDDEDAQKKKDADAAKRKADDDKRSLEQQVSDLQTELRAASTKQLTEDEFAARAPESIRAIIADKRAADAAEATTLITTLRAASAVYSDEELAAKPLSELRKLAALAKVDVVDYSGRGIAQLRTADKGDYAPPNPYEAGIKAMQAKH